MRRWVAFVAVAAVLAASGPTAANESAVVTATVTAQPLEVTLTITPASVAAGERSEARARVVNHGTAPVRATVATLHLSERVAVRGPHARGPGTLNGGASVDIRWQLCSEHPGAYLALVRVEGTAADGTTLAAESPARLLTVGENPNPRRARCG